MAIIIFLSQVIKNWINYWDRCILQLRMLKYALSLLNDQMLNIPRYEINIRWQTVQDSYCDNLIAS